MAALTAPLVLASQSPRRHEILSRVAFMRRFHSARFYGLPDYGHARRLRSVEAQMNAALG